MMSLNEILHDVETDSGSRFVVARLIEGSEDFLLFVRTDSHSVVFYLDAEMGSILQQATGQVHIISGIFQGVGHQIADNLGNGLLIYHRHEIISRIINIKTDAFLLEGRSEAFCHSMHQLRNVVQMEMNLHALLLHFVEIEQLIDEQEQTLGITVDNRKRLRDSLTISKFSGNLFPMLFQALQRSDDKRYRRTDFMGNHREELQAGISHLLILLEFQLVEFFLMTALFTLQPALHEPVDCVTDEQKIQNLGRQRPPERRMNHNLQSCLILRPYTIIIGCLN